jgi:thiamine monophosphate synthase
MIPANAGVLSALGMLLAPVERQFSRTHTTLLDALDIKALDSLQHELCAQALRAIRAEPDYLAIGPVYATRTKPTALPVTLDYVRWAAANVSLPWFAIGGITLDNLDELLEAGARRICVVSAILNAPDVAKACQQFRERLTSAAR